MFCVCKFLFLFFINSTFSCVTVLVTINANSSNGPIYIANHIQFTYYVGCVHYCLSFPFRFCVVTLTCSKAPSLNMTQCAKSVRASVISGFSPILSNRKYVSLPQVSIPAYSVKQMVRGDLRIFSSKRSFLLRKRMMEVSPNHLLLQIESNSFKLSCIRF